MRNHISDTFNSTKAQHKQSYEHLGSLRVKLFAISLVLIMLTNLASSATQRTYAYDDCLSLSLGGAHEGGPFYRNKGLFQIAISNPITGRGSSGLTYSVDYEVQSGTAIVGLDFEPTNGTAQFRSGSIWYYKLMSFPIIDDNIYEGAETFKIILSKPQNIGICAGSEVKFGKISDNDPAPKSTPTQTPQPSPTPPACLIADKLSTVYEQQKGTNRAAFAHQFACLARKVCENIRQDGTQGWGAGFPQFMIEYLTKDGIPESVIESCGNKSNAECFHTKGVTHGWELAKGFWTYGALHGTPEDHLDWNFDHEEFLNNAVKGCFDEVRDEGELDPQTIDELKQDVIRWVRILRGVMQGITAPKSFQIASTLLQSQEAENPIMNELTKNDLYDVSLARSSLLNVEETTFFLPIGTKLQLRVTKKQPNGEIRDLTEAITGTKYQLNVDPAIATISANGLLYIKGTKSPLVSLPNMLYVFVFNGNDFGVGQFAITDEDLDMDSLGDNFERQIGLSSEFKNTRDSDIDGDSVPDIGEAIIGTMPTKKDSDNNNVSDGCDIGKTLPEPEQSLWLSAFCKDQIPTQPLCFTETRQCINSRFRVYWERNGGLAIFGYPITPLQAEARENTVLQVQWFERNRLELHQENEPPYDVLVGRIGSERLEQLGRDWHTFPTSEARTDCYYFPETKHNICGEIYSNGVPMALSSTVFKVRVRQKV